MPTYDEIMKTIREKAPEALRENSKYQPKLTFNARCSALAALIAGFSTPIVAEAFKVNRSTLRYIRNPHSPHYRNVRKEYHELGKERFVVEYLTPDVIEMLQEAMKSPNINKSTTEIRAEKAVDTTSPNRKATSREGRHIILCGLGTFYVEVKWYDTEQPPFDADVENHDKVREPGWYLEIDTTSPAYDDSMTNPAGANGARYTSKLALDWFLTLVEGELQE